MKAKACALPGLYACRARRWEQNMDYKKSGVDIEAGYRSVELMKEYVKETLRPEVLGGLGGIFRGVFPLFY